ncbi:HAMP domain-containing sensor histidine kinase [Tepidibacter aestuarii]|uniref:HAMP domain-containing sensor histidine kinase n=1 Tax=Tepidibacter aestuarii TaxID=2925782 RepID=UPI0020BDD0A0|nr:HAMP domain-containing sensor histidine kinase [Tepidibacter aestuarii]CAH2214501.1 two-component system, OmpR family, sensor histidine kinase VanS [Tepidibacter aestuarii]
MKYKGITFKLFIVTTAFFMFFLTVNMILQTVFFEDFYVDRKIKTLEKNIEKFTDEYLTINNKKNMHKKLSLFSDENNALIAILDKNGLIKYNDKFDITITDSTGKNITVLLNNFMDIYQFESLNVEIGESVSFEGTYLNKEKSILVPLNMEIDGMFFWGYESDINKNIQIINGEIKKMNIPSSTDNLQPYDDYMFVDLVNEFFWENKESNFELDGRIINYSYIDDFSQIENIVFVKPIIKDGDITEMVFVSSSLQQIGEAMTIMKEYYVYVFIAALLFILILAFVYSKMIAAPLVKINKSAIKMADLDFSSYCDIKSKDEIGSLASSLNSLSKNLNSTLEELKKANAKLEKDIEKEKKLEKMRKEFISSASHEFKTPLGIIKGFAEGIKDGIYENKKEYYLGVIIDETEKMNDLVLDMLELSKLESKSYKLNKEELIIDKLFYKVINKFKYHIEEKKISINFDVGRQNIFVYGDKRGIEQVIVNLFSNAIRHTGFLGNINIDIKMQNMKVYIYIENSGKNIPKEKIDKIWDRFYRVEESRHRQSGGTGLGLSIVKNILEIHDSEYGVKNTDDGVLFYFTLEKMHFK